MHRFRRQDSLRRLADERFDVLVVGGGVTGAGVALDAASRGLKAALVEKHDFASGTSSKSSKMVHGGLRYLQQREFRLVYENLAERQRLLDNAPHLVSPLPFLIPLFGHDGVVSKTVARSYSVALSLYDLTGGIRIGARHKRVTRDQALRHLPTLNAERLVAGFLYFDARADDARLTLSLARTAALDHGAVVANYTPVVGLTGAGGRTAGAIVRADPDDPASEFLIHARVVVNATGVWADDLRALDEGSHPRSIRPAKGVHVTVPGDRLPCDIAAVIPVPKDRRSIFVVPWPDTNLVYLGTTDTDYQGPLDDPSCTPEDVDYLLDAANSATTSRLTRADVTGVWAGLRPLLASPAHGGHVPERTADLSRRHTVRTSERGMVTVTGGKLTTYRKMAQDTVDAVVRQLGESPARRRCVTASLPSARCHHGHQGPGGHGPRAGAPPRPLRHRVRRGSRAGRGEARAPRIGRRRPALHGSGAGLRRARGDGPDASRRAGPPDPGGNSARRPHHGRSPRRGVAHRPRHGVGRTGGLQAGQPLHRLLPEGAPHRRARSPVSTPTPVTPIDAEPQSVTDRLPGPSVVLPDGLVDRLVRSGLEVSTDAATRAEAGRDWWPLAIGWAMQGSVPHRPALVVRPTSTAQVSTVLAACNEAVVPVTPVGGRSGVCGGSIPVFGGVALDLTSLEGLVAVDETSLTADVRAGTFGPDLEGALGRVGTGYTLGHWPQSMDLSTVGGWLACRSAGQFSTRYGKIEDMVLGLEVVLADGRTVRTEGHGPRAATGPNLTQLFVGSEGTLGVITEARLRVHPLPPSQERRAFGFDSFAQGLAACRRILRRGATPAVLRLYDEIESDRHFEQRDTNVLIVLDEADPSLLAATLSVVDDECTAAAGARSLDPALVGRWLGHRNDVSALVPLWRSGIVVDTVEVSASWSAAPDLFEAVLSSLRAIDGTLVASAHQSHAYGDGACLYFTFAGRGPEGDDLWRERFYRQAWDSVTDATLAHGAAISHHHGIGLNRARFMAGALGSGFDVLARLKRVLDPRGILNPAKLGLPSTFGPAPWP